jgi:fatty acid CoA ligase FadD32
MSLAERDYLESMDRFVPANERFAVRPLTSYLFDRADSPEPAFTFLDYSGSRDGEARTVSWAELASKVSAVAAELAKVTSPGQRVAILAPQDLNYVIGFLGALHAGTIAVPLFAPEVSQHGDRLVNALADCTPEVWLTAKSALDNVRALAEDKPVFMPKQIIAVDDLETNASHELTAVELDLDSPAYLQYTSGSTRAPAGAIITHRAVSHNSWQVATAFGVQKDWTCVGWIPFFHDMGLVQLLCVPVLAGVPSVFMTPFNFVMKPLRWLKQLAEYPNTFAAAPNFAFDYAAKKVKEADRLQLDLSGVKVIINGSEPVQAKTIETFEEIFAAQGFPANAHRPSYGLAEATVFVSNTREQGPTIVALDRTELGQDRKVQVERGSKNSVELVGAGRTLGQLVQIVHPEKHTLCSENEIGEIWAHGPNVASGYWEQPERSVETFGGEIVDPPAGVPTGPWLRTGDLGIFVDDQLYITGRIKDLIIIDGKNHYPQDIEATVQNSHPAVKQDRVAAFAVTSPAGKEEVVVLAEYDRKGNSDTDHQEVAKIVRRAVTAAHDLKLRDFQLVSPGSIIRTSSGKIARAATKKRLWDVGSNERA